MPSNKQQSFEPKPHTEGRSPLATVFGKAHQKAHGTRVGMLQDWREGSTSGTAPRRKTNALRDGR